MTCCASLLRTLPLSRSADSDKSCQRSHIPCKYKKNAHMQQPGPSSFLAWAFRPRLLPGLRGGFSGWRASHPETWCPTFTYSQVAIVGQTGAGLFLTGGHFRHV